MKIMCCVLCFQTAFNIISVQTAKLFILFKKDKTSVVLGERALIIKLIATYCL